MGEETTRLNERIQLLEEELARLRSDFADRPSAGLAAVAADAVSVPVAVLNAAGTIVYCNAAWDDFVAEWDLTGARVSLRENYVARLKAVGGPNEDTALQAARGIESVLIGEIAKLHLDYYVVAASGIRWLTLHVRPAIQAGERGCVVSHLFGAERLQAHDLLRQGVTLESAALEDMSEAVMAWDTDGTPKLCNRAAREWLGMLAPGVPLAEWTNRLRFEAYDAESGAFVAEADRPLARALRGEAVHNAELAIEVPGHSRRFIVASADPVPGQDGNIHNVVAVWRDITDWRIAFDHLRETQRRYREVQRVGRVGSWEYKPRTGELWGSTETKRIHEYPTSKAFNNIGAFLLNVRERQAFLQALQDLVEAGAPFDLNVTLQPPGDRAPKVLSYYGELVHDTDGEAIKVVGVVRDITVEMRAQASVKEISDRMRLALDAAGAKPFEWDLRTNAILSTDQGPPLLGSNAGSFDWRYATFIQCVHEDDVPQLEAALAAARASRTECGHQFRVVWPDGTIHWLEVRGRCEYDPDGTPTRMAGVIMEITKRRKAEEDQERLASIVECTSNAIISVDLDGSILTWNPAAERMFLYSSEEARGKPIAELVAPEMSAAVRRILSRVWRGESCGPVETRAFGKDGAELDIAFTAVPIRLRNTIVGAAAIVRDVTEAKRTRQRLDTQLAHLQALRSVDVAILGATDTRLTLGTIVNHALLMPGVVAASILLLDPSVHTLNYSVGGGFKGTSIVDSRIRLGDGLAGKAAMKRRPIVAPPDSLDADTPARARAFAQEGFTSYAAFPLVAKGEVEGVLEVFGRTPFDTNSDTLEFLEAVAGQAAIAIDSAVLFENLQRSNMNLVLAYDATIEGWSKALDLRDAATKGHSERVTDMAIRLAYRLAVPDDLIEHIRRGALLHDIGKMAIPDSILLSPGRLTATELGIMRRHTDYAYELLSPIEFLRPAIDIPHCHHERWDGSGYPRGLKNRHIPLSARIFAVVDVWDALRSDRPYRPAWSRDEALRYIRERAGIEFDPAVVEAFLEIVE